MSVKVLHHDRLSQLHVRPLPGLAPFLNATFLPPPIHAPPRDRGFHGCRRFRCSESCATPRPPGTRSLQQTFRSTPRFHHPLLIVVLERMVSRCPTEINLPERLRFLPSRHRKWAKSCGCCCRDKMAPGNRLSAGAWGRPGSAPVQTLAAVLDSVSMGHATAQSSCGTALPDPSALQSVLSQAHPESAPPINFLGSLTQSSILQ